jgi:competence protein ComEC
MRTFTAIPFLRIILPFIAGILLGLHTSIRPLPLMPVLSAVLIVITYRWHRRVRWRRRLWIGGCDLVILLCGWMMLEHCRITNNPFYYGRIVNPDSVNIYSGVIDEIPEQKAKTIKAYLTLDHAGPAAHLKPVAGRIVVYFRKGTYANRLQAGDAIILKARLAPPPSPLNPGEFDYRRYLANKNIQHIGFADSSAFLKTGSGKLNSVWQAGINTRLFIIRQLAGGGLTPDAFAISAALVTGYDDDIDDTVMRAFANTGTLHVLSVSGLHVGIIYLIVNYVLGLFIRTRPRKLLRFAVTIVVLWSFALMTGFSAPVLRAVIMFTFLGAGKIFFRSTSAVQLNILFFSAFLLLSYNPLLITDIGFLLSYLAMIGLFVFQPLLSQMVDTENRFIRYIWDNTAASIAATLTTLPVTLLFFKQFPLWFAVCNLFVVPVTLILLMGALAVVCHMPFIFWPVNKLTSMLIAFIGFFGDTTSGTINGINFTLTDALCLSLVLVLFTSIIHFRHYRLVYYTIIVVIVWQVKSIMSSAALKSGGMACLYQLKNANGILVKNGARSILYYSDSSTYQRVIQAHLTLLDNPETQVRPFNYFEVGRHRVMLVNTYSSWPECAYENITELIIQNNSVIPEPALRRCRSLRRIIADGSNSLRKLRETEEISRKFGVEFYSTHKQGALLLFADEAENW